MNKYEIGSDYFPGYHPEPMLDKYHGAGWSEWELPLCGYDDESSLPGW